MDKKNALTHKNHKKQMEKVIGNHLKMIMRQCQGISLVSFAFIFPAHTSQFYFHQSRKLFFRTKAREQCDGKGGRKNKQTRVICLLQFYEPKTFCLFMMSRVQGKLEDNIK